MLLGQLKIGTRGERWIKSWLRHWLGETRKQILFAHTEENSSSPTRATLALARVLGGVTDAASLARSLVWTVRLGLSAGRGYRVSEPADKGVGIPTGGQGHIAS